VSYIRRRTPLVGDLRRRVRCAGSVRFLANHIAYLCSRDALASRSSSRSASGAAISTSFL
jgi:hypothetical protein